MRNGRGGNGRCQSHDPEHVDGEGSEEVQHSRSCLGRRQANKGSCENFSSYLSEKEERGQAKGKTSRGR